MQLESTFRDRALVHEVQGYYPSRKGEVPDQDQAGSTLRVSKPKVKIPMHYGNQVDQVEGRRNHLEL
jgi:hypothetical protein